MVNLMEWAMYFLSQRLGADKQKLERPRIDGYSSAVAASSTWREKFPKLWRKVNTTKKNVS